MVSILVTLAIAAVAWVAYSVIISLLDIWFADGQGPGTLPTEERTELSDTDEEMVIQTRELIVECFGDNMTETIGNLKNKDRVVAYAEFAEKLAKLYGLDIETDVGVYDATTWGYYSWDDKAANFNINLLMRDKSDPHFEYFVRESIDTIIHELRHAVQHKSISEDGFWNVSDERRKQWAHNMTPGNYIRASVDLNGYRIQPIEADAFTFAATVMEGVN